MRVLSRLGFVAIGASHAASAHAATMSFAGGMSGAAAKPEVVIACVIVAQVYGASGLIIRYVFSAESEALRRHHHESFLKALDIPPGVVVGIAAAPRALLVVISGLSLSIGAVSGLSSIGQLPPPAVVSLPYVVTAVTGVALMVCHVAPTSLTFDGVVRLPIQVRSTLR